MTASRLSKPRARGREERPWVACPILDEPKVDPFPQVLGKTTDRVPGSSMLHEVGIPGRIATAQRMATFKESAREGLVDLAASESLC